MSKPATKISATPAPADVEIATSTDRALPATAGTPPTTAAPAPLPTPDPHAGMGGHYRVVNGVRRLIERTGADPATQQARPAD